MLWIGLLVVFLGALVTLLACQRRFIFPRHLVSPDPNAGEGITGLERIWLNTEEGRVESWFMPGDGINSDHPGPAVLFAHGNAELIETWPEIFSDYQRMGISVFLPEYRGYGRSAGSPSEKTIISDFSELYDLLAARSDVDRQRIFFHGRSIGGGVVGALSRERKPAALILQSTFTSLKDMGRRFLVPGSLILDSFDTLSAISKLDIPILIIHGQKDELIPFSHSEKLHQASPQSTFIAYNCDHNSCPPDWNIYWKDIRTFLIESKILP